MTEQVQHNIETTFANRASREKAEAEDLKKRLRKVGYASIYGGGSDSKGHGFWLQQNGARTHFVTYAVALGIAEESEREAAE